ncbi:transketolase C-terminal domain-containing protein [Agathobaculum sp. NTUH-O15-33]|uniref:transketolase family protein n=1 Tax=Agathobaculum sp. NTUH-O15-33 TaxID=3079302 RepID=UPI00295832DF|nr:transketolase C-terminal domain-containing protein [Agathobaculum sp. NTUH-O15-33]WNX85492.1 transketolase C-terminal domain-containing protein [Agathobaculum sp. NTUH-O15-33]
MVKLEAALQEEAREMRAVFAEVMEELSQKDKRVVYLDADIINSIGMTDFWKAHPDRTVNCGIQEANMIGMAAGMSATGLIPFAHTFGTFATRRVMDQVFLSAAYAKLNVRIIGSDPGVTAALNGGTHMPFEDMGMMRCIPGVTILEPTDSVMLADLMRQTKDRYGVFYIRLSRKKAEKIYEDGSTFEIGKAVKLRDGNDVMLFATGIAVADALRASDLLAKEKISAGVSNMFTIKPIDEQAVIEAAKFSGAIVTAENHNVINGLGSAVSEVLTGHHCCPLERVGVQDRFGEVGDVAYLKKTLHLTAEDIAEAAKRAIARKG